MNKECNDCSHKSEQVRTYVDEKTGMLCAEICDENIELPKDSIVLIPLVCTTCGTLNWKSVNTKEEGQHKNIEQDIKEQKLDEIEKPKSENKN